VRFQNLRNYSAVITAIMLIGICSVRPQTALASTVDIKPGDNIPAVVAANPAGTTFIISPGTYRLQAMIIPKDGDVFIGPCSQPPCAASSQAVLSGARLLTAFQHTGSYYYAAGQTQQGAVTIDSTKCYSGYEGCIYPEDLFFDDKPLQHVTALSDVRPGKWFFDYSTHIIYFYDNPSGHRVETSVTAGAFAPGPGNNVTIRGLTVEKFATPIMTGAIAGQGTGNGTTTQAVNWIVKQNEVRFNHAAGVKPNYGWHVGGNYIHDNGDFGVSAGFDSSVASNLFIQWNQISNNNYAHVTAYYGSGGVKLFSSRGVVIRGNNVHDNLGAAIHMDTDNYLTLIDNNTVADNWDGIAVEVSYSATVRNNKLLRNGYLYPSGTTWLYEGQLLSSTSRNVEAYCNTAEVSSQGGNGMSIIAQPRNTWENQLSTNNYYHHNTVVFEGNSGFMGGAYAPLSELAQFVNNRFDYNSYHFPNLSRKALSWSALWEDFSGFQSKGEDTHGTADTLNGSTVPNVVITSPGDQANISALTDVTGKAGGGTIDKVEFYVDWTLQSTTSGDSFSFALNPNGLSAGPHTVAAMAYNSGGIRSCHAITVNVQ
jgi:parallel beta-helix repeat protein